MCRAGVRRKYSLHCTRVCLPGEKRGWAAKDRTSRLAAFWPGTAAGALWPACPYAGCFLQTALKEGKTWVRGYPGEGCRRRAVARGPDGFRGVCRRGWKSGCGAAGKSLPKRFVRKTDGRREDVARHSGLRAVFPIFIKWRSRCLL